MTRSTGIRITSFAQARKMLAAEKLSEAVKKPAILTLAQVRTDLSGCKLVGWSTFNSAATTTSPFNLPPSASFGAALKKLDCPLCNGRVPTQQGKETGPQRLADHLARDSREEVSACGLS